MQLPRVSVRLHMVGYNSNHQRTRAADFCRVAHTFEPRFAAPVYIATKNPLQTPVFTLYLPPLLSERARECCFIAKSDAENDMPG